MTVAQLFVALLLIGLMLLLFGLSYFGRLVPDRGSGRLNPSRDQ